MSNDDDLEKKWDDYDRRVAKAGSTEGIIGGLVQDAKRNKKITQYLIISIILDVLFSIALTFIAFSAQTNASDADFAAHVACQQSNENTFAINELLRELIFNTNSLPISNSEKAQRTEGYADLIMDLRDC